MSDSVWTKAARRLAAVLTFVLALFAQAGDQVILDYEARLSVGGQPFDGLGRFRFQLVDGAGKVRWDSAAGLTNPPNGVVGDALPVRNGVYSVQLGDPSLAHPPLTAGLIREGDALNLRVWFLDGSRGWQKVGPDASLGAPTAAAGPSANEQIESLRHEVTLLQAQLARSSVPSQATNRARTPTAPRSVNLAWRDRPVLGDPNAPLVMIEFSDFQCPACRQTHKTLFKALITNFVDVGQLLIVGRQLPLPQHKLAPDAARAAFCAGRQDSYFEMSDRLFSDPLALSTNDIAIAARDLGLNIAAFESCLSDPVHEARLKEDAADAQAVGVTAIPSFILGRRHGDQVSGVLLVGGQSMKVLQEEIDRLLKSP